MKRGGSGGLSEYIDRVVGEIEVYSSWNALLRLLCLNGGAI